VWRHTVESLGTVVVADEWTIVLVSYYNRTVAAL
jgi:hypothetical protein